MTTSNETGEERFARLAKSVRDRLSSKDQTSIEQLMDANEFGVALELIVDAFAEEQLAFSQAEVGLIETLSKGMNMYPSILDRYPGGLAPKNP